MFSFGSGVLFGTRTDAGLATPLNFGLVQSVQMDSSYNLKELYGQYQFPVAIARGMGKISGKAPVARISGLAFTNLFFGQAISSGQVATAFGEAGTVPGTPYQITVANSAQFVEDLGVINAVTGLPLTKVASGPTTGQYSVAAGVYTFAAADTTITVLINYTYTIAGTGEKFTQVNALVGTTPTFSARFYTTFEGKTLNVTYNKCVSSKLSLASKLEDFMTPDFEFSALADAAGNIATYSFGEAS